MSTKRERMYVPAGSIELRVEGEPGAEEITGLVAPYSVWSPVYGFADYKWREQIAPGFFDAALAAPGADIRALFNHSPDWVLGRTTSKTAEAWTDEKGLHGRIKLSESTLVRDMVVIPMRRGDLTGASFSFYLAEGPGADVWTKGEDGLRERTLLKARQLDDFGPVTFPFYPQTELSARAAESAVESLKRWEAEHGADPEAWRAAALEREAELREAELGL